MSNKIQIKRLDGGVLVPSATWRQVTSRKNGITGVFVLEGSGPSFAIDNEMNKLRGVSTNWGIYKEHSLVQGSPGIYDQISITFQTLIEPPIYIYDFNSTLVSQPLQSHPGYRTYWDHHLVRTDGTSGTLLTNTEMNTFQAINDGTIPSAYQGKYAWRKSGQAIGNDVVIAWDANGATPDSGHKSGEAKLPGLNSCKIPSISVTETIYFLEAPSFTFKWFGFTLTTPSLNSKTIASMAGKVGWPLHNTFGYPRDTYALINDPTIYDVSGAAVTTDYSDYRKVGKLRVETGESTETISDVVMNETFMKKRGIPITQYLNTSPIAGSLYSKNKYGHPLWRCETAKVKRVGYWYEATLKWEYFNFGLTPDLYPLASARILGLA